MLSILRTLLKLSFFLLISSLINADEIKVNNFSLILEEENTYNLKINYSFSLNEKLNDLISIGIPIYFESELIVTYPVKYTFGLYRKKIYKKQKIYRVIYSPITNTYKVSSGMLSQAFNSLPMAINVIKKINSFQSNTGSFSQNSFIDIMYIKAFNKFNIKKYLKEKVKFGDLQQFYKSKLTVIQL